MAQSNHIEVVRQVLRDHPEINPKDEIARGFIPNRVAQILNEKVGRIKFGRKARNKDGSNKNTDGLTELIDGDGIKDGHFYIYDILKGSDPNGKKKPTDKGYDSDPGRFAMWDGGSGNPIEAGENGYFSPPENMTIPIPGPVPDTTDLEGRIREVQQENVLIKRELDELREELSKYIKHDDKVAFKTNKGYFLCAEQAGYGETDTMASVRYPGNANFTRKGVGDWETLTIRKV